MGAMVDGNAWQYAMAKELSARLKENSAVKAVVLTGSLADDAVEIDEWSDVDLKVIVADASLSALYHDTTWLAPDDEIIAVDRVEQGCSKILRVCLAPLRRLDISWIPVSELQNTSEWAVNPFPGKHAILWSRIPGLAELIAAIALAPPFEDDYGTRVGPMADSFWFKAAIAVGKVARNDLLVGLHLALDLVRDCLVLQMMLRDREKGTNVHRRGDGMKDVVARLCTRAETYSAAEILDVLVVCGPLFDELAAQLSCDYRKRWSALEPAVRRAGSEATRRV